MIGFALRKLGRVDEAMGYYQRVLELIQTAPRRGNIWAKPSWQIGDPVRAQRAAGGIF